MELRRRRKKKRLSDAILPIGVCLLVVFLTAVLCLHKRLHATERSGSTLTRPAEDANFQLGTRHRHAGTSGETHKNEIDDDDGSKSDSNDENENENDDEDEDPARLDPPITPEEISRVEALRLPEHPGTMANPGNPNEPLPYDVRRCPPQIPENYPYAWSILDVLGHWNPDNTTVPERVHQGLCIIDWRDPEQRKTAVRYRRAEVPFVVKHHPVIWKAADRWTSEGYLHSKLGDKAYRNEHSVNNHMMYWKLRGKRRGPPGWEPPTQDVKLSYPDWREKALEMEQLAAHQPESIPKTEHFYLRLNGAYERAHEWLFDELPFFDPSVQNNIFMVDPTDARGINCRLGSRGTIAEAHYDMSRNFILILNGRKRYILAHPEQCSNLELYPMGHPSARHSRVNWSDPMSYETTGKFPHSMVNEVVLEAGDGLYLPTYWLHFIVSLSLNYQCNARSGITRGYQEHINACGFGKL